MFVYVWIVRLTQINLQFSKALLALLFRISENDEDIVLNQELWKLNNIRERIFIYFSFKSKLLFFISEK